MRNFLLLLLCLSGTLSLSSQPNISGVINVYASVSDVDYCANSLEVDQTTGFSADMTVILIQMQGASINASNSPVYGDLTDLGGAGLFEKATIASISGNTINLQNALIHTYNLSGQLQLVSLPNYENATITDTLTADAWDGNKGGILALEVTNTLHFESLIDVSGLGFRGGEADIAVPNNCNFATTANNYAYPITDWRGGLKGEGIALPLVNQETGRGALTNAGGGGNDHNSGGGGGANLSAGGQGGENREPTFFGCDGNFPGIGGKALPQMDNRLFLGGGGGAGHENNDVGSNGGNGGGIIILIAQILAGDDKQILANGQTPLAAFGDGAGGGGAGGSIWLETDGSLGNLSLEVKGGNGGISNNINFDRCIGPGGGGSGGVIYVNPIFGFNVDMAGGLAGMSINSNDNNCPDGTNGATAGADGLKLDIGTVEEGSETNTAPMITEIPDGITACIGDEIDLIAVVEGFDLTFQWQLDMGSGFQDISDNEQFTGTQSNSLHINNVTAEFSDYTFRLIVGNDCFAGITSDPISIDVVLLPTAEFSFVVDGLNVVFANLSENGTAYNWDFGDTSTSDEINPSHTYAMQGTYEVSLTISNECGEESFSQTVSLDSAPEAAFSVSPIEGCVPLTVQFTNESTGATSLAWVFPGGDPGFSTQEIPLVTYNTIGTYSATLIASNSAGVDTLTLENIVSVSDIPQADFSVAVDGLTATFTNLAVEANSYYWVFGDTQISIEENPVHTYSEPGIYDVFFRVTNPCGVTSIVIPVTIGSIPTPAFSVDMIAACAPAFVQFTNESSGDYDNLEWTFPGGDPSTSTEVNPAISYSEPGLYDVSLSLFGPLGNPVLTEQGIIEVLPTPEPDFTFDINGLTVSFTNNSQFANSFTWNFGDGATSTEENPIHTFPTGGVYEVTLNALNNFCGRAFNETIFVNPTAVVESNTLTPIKVFPNPFKTELTLEKEPRMAIDGLSLELRNLKGQTLATFSVDQSQRLDLAAYPAGMYYLVFYSENGIWIEKVIKIE